MKKQIAAFLSVTAALAGCSTAPKDIAAYYTSPMQYQSYDCKQLASETGLIQVRINEVGGRLDEAASNDKKITGAGMVLIWPLFLLGGTEEQEHEYSRLKGEYDAVQQAAVLKKCPGAVAPAQTVSSPSVKETAETTQKR